MVYKTLIPPLPLLFSSLHPTFREDLLKAKKLGFSDKQIAAALSQTEVNVRAFREENGEPGAGGRAAVVLVEVVEHGFIDS